MKFHALFQLMSSYDIERISNIIYNEAIENVGRYLSVTQNKQQRIQNRLFFTNFCGTR